MVNFFLFRVLPGDPARTLGRGRFTHAGAARGVPRTYGLDQPLPQQFVTYLKNTFTGDLGDSLRYRVPVSDLILDRLWPTVLLVGTSTILADGDRRLDRHPRRLEPRQASSTRSRPAGTLTLYSMPEWWLGLLLIAVFAVGSGPIPGLFPTGGLHSIDVDPGTISGRRSTPPGTWSCR